MPKKPNSVEELQAFVSTYAEAGKINGEQIILDNSVELQGYVTADLYNRALYRSAPWGFDKGKIATTGVFLLLQNPAIKAGIGFDIPTYRKEQEGVRHFRSLIPLSTYNLLHKYIDAINLNTSQITTLVLTYFAHDATVEQIYQQFLADTTAKFNASEEQVEETIDKHLKLKARTNRLNLKLAGDPEAEAEKLT